MPTVVSQLQAILRRALAAALPDLPADFEASVTPAADARFGDYQANAAMTLAKARRTNPRALAAQIVEALKADAELEKISAPPEIAGAGFINFRLKPEFLATHLAGLDADPMRLGLSAPEQPRKIIIDFSSPNIAKPMHVGHLRSTIIGDCLARVARFLGHDVVTDNHLGDWGTQFGKVIYGWKHAPLDEAALAVDPLAELVRIYQFANAKTDEEKARFPEKFDRRRVSPEEIASFLRRRHEMPTPVTDLCRIYLFELQHYNPDLGGHSDEYRIWKICVNLSRAELDRIYERLGIHFDYTFGESYFNPRLADVVADLEKLGIAQPSEGALVVFFPDDPRLTDKLAIIRKSDGAYNYATTDIATYEQRVGELGRDTIWVVVGAPQALHFEQLNAIVRRMKGADAVPITHVPFGSILGEDRKIMRTRSGDNVALTDLLDEAEERARAIVEEKNAELSSDEKTNIARAVGLGAVKYAELSQHRLTDYIFSWDRMLSFQGNTAPYLQNAYVRIRSIFRRGELDPEAPADANVPLALTEPAERDLAKKLAQFAETVPAVLDDFRPNLLANYLYELAGTFHTFFEACPVLKADAGTPRETRLTLCRVTARVLRTGLGLLGIDVPERM